MMDNKRAVRKNLGSWYNLGWQIALNRRGNTNGRICSYDVGDGLVASDAGDREETGSREYEQKQSQEA